MNLFVWNPMFETGIALVDAQHRRLVSIINHLGTTLISSTLDLAAIEADYQELADYAQQHFADEEGLMAAAGLSTQYIEKHRSQHRAFTGQVATLWQQRSQVRESMESLHGFLASWLTFHILDEDQAMARQLHRSGAATDPTLAISPSAPAEGRANGVLLAAMRELHRALADVNANLEAQVRARTRDLVQAEKMAAIGQLAAGVAHEINNPIAFVTSNLGTLGNYTTTLLSVIDSCVDLSVAHPELATKLESVIANADLQFVKRDLLALMAESRDGLHRVKTIVAALRDFAREDLRDRSDTNLLDGLESTLSVAASMLKGKVELIRHLTPLPPVRCVPGQINQVFMILLVNAIQAITAIGTIMLRSGFDVDGVWVEIADNGCGISDAHRHRLFEPFFTTRPVGGGIGLGLATAWDIVVKNHAGRIDVRSESPGGSSFTVWLPREADEAKGPGVAAI